MFFVEGEKRQKYELKNFAAKWNVEWEKLVNKWRKDEELEENKKSKRVWKLGAQSDVSSLQNESG